VTGEGRVKILDFGLAKLVERGVGSEDAATGSTTLAPLTGEGQIVGTIAYMSPEQAAGGQLDARSDIFSFGAMLYEMVTGRRPFGGDTGQSTLAAILTKEPVPPSSIVGELPFELERAVLRCLRKDPPRRWQTMADLKVALQELKDELDSGKVSAVTVPLARPAHRMRMLAGVLGLVLLLAAAAIGWWLLRTKATPVSYEMERLTFDGAAALSPAISPDGNLIVYASDRTGSFSLYLRQFRARQGIQLTDQASADWYPSFSPDGLKLVYRSERGGGGLYIRNALGGPGGAEMKLVDGGELPRFSPDGATIAYVVPDALTSRARLFLVPAGGGAPRHLQPDLVAMYPSPFGHQPPLWSPDGTNILFRGMRVGDAKKRGWWIVPAAGGEPAAIEGVPAEPQWLARYALAWRGEYIYYLEGEPINGSTVYRVRLAPRPWRITGTPEKLTSYSGVSLDASTSAGGRMVLASVTVVPNIWSASLKADKGTTSGQLERVTADSNGKRRLTVAANGSMVAYSSYGPPGQANVEVRLRDIATGRESLIAGSGKYPFLDPVLSADGSKVAYTDLSEEKLVTYVAEVGSASGRVVCQGCRFHAFFPNNAEALVQVNDRLMRHRLDGGGQVLLAQIPSFVDVALSPDGKWLAFTQARQDGTAALHQTDITHPPSLPESWKLVAEDRNYLGSPAWSPDGRLLYYVSQRDGSPCVWAQPFARDGNLTGAATAVLHLHSGNGALGRQTRIGVTSDRLFVLLSEVKGEVMSIKLER